MLEAEKTAPEKTKRITLWRLGLGSILLLLGLKNVNIPRQSRGLYGVSRSKRLERGR
jgi:hypothetical protein